MKRSVLASVVVLAGFLSACADEVVQPEVATAALARAAERAHPGHLVQFDDGVPADFEARVTALGGAVNFVVESAGFASVSGLDGRSAAKLGAGRGVSAAFPDVQVQLNTPRSVVSVPDVTGGVQSVANPAAALLFATQWNMRVVRADVAWAANQLGSPDVTVAILDTGIDYNGLDMNGVVDLTRSRSFVPSDSAYLVSTPFAFRLLFDDLNGHGTNVAAQVATNGTAFAGVNSKTTLLSVKVLGRTGSGSLGGILAGLVWAADQGADVANLSIGIPGGVRKSQLGPRVNGLTNRVINYANQRGMVIVVAAGNDGANLDEDGGGLVRSYCKAPHVVCVAATGPTASANLLFGPWLNQDALAPYSNYGEQVMVSAPGGSNFGLILSVCARLTVQPGVDGAPDTFPCLGGGTVVGMAGTSQAAPHVAGLVAKLVEVHGRGNPVAVKEALLESLDDLGAPGFDPIYGYGRINVGKAFGL